MNDRSPLKPVARMTTDAQRMCCAACAEGRPEHVITDAAGRPWRFEMHHFCGPIVLRKDGQPKERQPGSRSPFWLAFDAWSSARKAA